MLKRLKKILSFSIYLLGVLIATFIIITFVAQKNVVQGQSMSPTLEDGDNLITEKLSYRFGKVRRYDVIVFRSKDRSGDYIIKRVIGLPGETVKIDSDGSIYINDKILKESYGNEVIEDPGMALGDVVIGVDEYFVLGDNRNNSVDSRNAGIWLVKKDEIVGRVLVRLWPNFGEI